MEKEDMLKGVIGAALIGAAVMAGKTTPTYVPVKSPFSMGSLPKECACTSDHKPINCGNMVVSCVKEIKKKGN